MWPDTFVEEVTLARKYHEVVLIHEEAVALDQQDQSFENLGHSLTSRPSNEGWIVRNTTRWDN